MILYIERAVGGGGDARLQGRKEARKGGGGVVTREKEGREKERLTTVSACPSFSWGPLRVMVLTSESEGGTSTHTPVVWSTSWRPWPRGPTMYLCWVFFTSTDTVPYVRHCRYITIHARWEGDVIIVITHVNLGSVYLLAKVYSSNLGWRI